jgi:hypothetical protein
MKTAGIILAIVGLLMSIFTGFNMITKKKVIDIGSVEVTKEKKEPVNWSPAVGIVLLVSGIGLIAFDRNKK